MFFIKLWKPAARFIFQKKSLIPPLSWTRNIRFIRHLGLFNHVLTVVYASSAAERTLFLKLLKKQARLDFIVTDLSVLSTLGKYAQKILPYYINKLNKSLAYPFWTINSAHQLNTKVLNKITKASIAQKTFHCCLIANHSLNNRLKALSLHQSNNLHSLRLEPCQVHYDERTVIKYMRNLTKFLPLESVVSRRIFLSIKHVSVLKNNQLLLNFSAKTYTSLAIGLLLIAITGTAINIKYNFFYSKTKNIAIKPLGTLNATLPNRLAYNHKKLPMISIVPKVSHKTMLPLSILSNYKEISSYTIQLAASKDLVQIKRLARELGLGLVKRQQLAKGIQPWYVLVTGKFSQLQQAKLALNQLPVKTIAQKPWIRNASELQDIS